MPNIPDRCKQFTSASKIVKQERQSKFTFENPTGLEVLVIQVDQCAITDGLRCDWMLIPNSLNLDIEIYLELKGSDVSHAVEQLETTIKKLSEDEKLKSKLCFIVSSRCPLLSPQIQKLKQRFKKSYNSTFQVKNKQDNYNLSSLCK